MVDGQGWTDLAGDIWAPRGGDGLIHVGDLNISPSEEEGKVMEEVLREPAGQQLCYESEISCLHPHYTIIRRLVNRGRISRESINADE